MSSAKKNAKPGEQSWPKPLGCPPSFVTYDSQLCLQMNVDKISGDIFFSASQQRPTARVARLQLTSKFVFSMYYLYICILYTISFLYKGWWIHQGHLYFIIYFYFSSIEIQNVSSISLAWPHSLNPCSSRKRLVVPFPTKMNICHPYQQFMGCNHTSYLSQTPQTVSV